MTDNDRLEFIKWLNESIGSNELLMKQMSGPAFSVHLKKMRVETMAMQVVLKILNQTTLENIGR